MKQHKFSCNGLIAGLRLATSFGILLATTVLCQGSCPPNDTNAQFSVTFISPKPPGAGIASPGYVWLDVTVSNGQPPVQVQFFVDTNTLLTTITNPPYRYTLTNVTSHRFGSQTSPIDHSQYPYVFAAVATDAGGNSVTSAPVRVGTPFQDSVQPTLFIADPPDGAVLRAGTPLTINAYLGKADGIPGTVGFFDGTNLLGTVDPWPGLEMITGLITRGLSSLTVTPYTITLTNLAPGNYEFTPGLESPGSTNFYLPVAYYPPLVPVHVTILPADIPPSVRLLSLPERNYIESVPYTMYSTSSVVRLEAQASSRDGSISHVNFYIGTLVGTVTNAPYVLLWTNVFPAGLYNVTAEAIDDGGQTGLSQAGGLIVTTNGGNAPVVDILSPTNGTRVAVGASFSALAFLTFSDNNINPVEFYVGTNLVGSVLNPPYQLQISNLAVGTYTLSARIKSLSGLASTGAVAQVTISDFLLHAARMDSTGNFHVHVGGLMPGTTNVVETSADLTTWAALSTNVVPTNYLDFVDVGASSECQRFYRCVRIP